VELSSKLAKLFNDTAGAERNRDETDDATRASAKMPPQSSSLLASAPRRAISTAVGGNPLTTVDRAPQAGSPARWRVFSLMMLSHAPNSLT